MKCARNASIPTIRVKGQSSRTSPVHKYELYLAVEDIDHTRTKKKSPHTNGFCERLQQDRVNEFYRVAFRKKLCRTLEELQVELDVWPQAIAQPEHGTSFRTLRDRRISC